MKKAIKRLGVTAAVCISSMLIFTACNNTLQTADNNTGNNNQIENEQNVSEQNKNSDDKNENNEKTASLVFSHGSGVYKEEFSLEITALEAGEIYYTTDGSDPAVSNTAKLYTGVIPVTGRSHVPNIVSAVDPVLISGNYNKVNTSKDGFTCNISEPDKRAVDKCMIIRAVLKQEDGNYSEETFSTYFIGTAQEHIQGLKESCEASGTSLAVISISMNYKDLFDSETGIYVKGDIFEASLAEYLESERLRDAETARSLDANYKQKGREWEREAAITFFEFSADGATEVFSQNCGIRIQGNYSRSDLQKGFRLYARTDYGENNFDYAVFGEDYVNVEGKVMDKFDTLVLRNGGNCAFTSKFNDTYWQSLVGDMNCATQKSRPCVVYLNGEYWGLYILQEDYTNDYMEDYYGVNKDDVVIYKGDAESLELGYKLDEGDLPEGIDDETYYFYELLEFFETHDNLKSEKDYNEFIKLVDPDSVMDYFAVQSWIDNKWDWPGKNWSMWRTTTSDSSNEYGDGRWRFMFYDIEFGGVCGSGDARNNTIKNDNYKKNGLLDMDTDNPAVLCFAYLMTNDNFREEFYDRLLSLSETYFEKEAALARLAEFEAVYGPLFEQFFARYPGTGSANEAINGGYATAACIRAFLEKRENNIQQMIDFCDEVLN